MHAISNINIDSCSKNRAMNKRNRPSDNLPCWKSAGKQKALTRGRTDHFTVTFPSILWPWTLIYDLQFLTWPRYCQDEPSCQICRSNVILFKSYCPAHRHVDTQTRRDDCSAGTTKVVSSETSDQSNLTQGRIPAIHGRFNRTRQVSPVCTSNLILYMLPLVHPSPHRKRHLDPFSRFCTAHGKVSVYFTMDCPFRPQNCTFVLGDLDPT